MAQRKIIVGPRVYVANHIPSKNDNPTSLTLLTHSPLFFFHSIIGLACRSSPDVEYLYASAIEVIVEVFQNLMERMFDVCFNNCLSSGHFRIL